MAASTQRSSDGWASIVRVESLAMGRAVEWNSLKQRRAKSSINAFDSLPLLSAIWKQYSNFKTLIMVIMAAESST